jgi:hypothetical protein
MEMADLAQILEEELEEAVEVKNKKSLHRYITLLTDNLVKKEDNKMEHTEFQQELIKIDGRFNQMIIEVREGFKRMDERFESVDKRFESVDKRFESVDKRFESIDKKFEAVQQQMNRRFDATDKRFNRQTAMMSIGFLVITSLITIYRFPG